MSGQLDSDNISVPQEKKGNDDKRVKITGWDLEVSSFCFWFLSGYVTKSRPTSK